MAAPAPGSSAIDVHLPFVARQYQLPFLRAMSQGCRRAALVWHRRAGKDVASWNLLITQALKRVGVYYYFGPTYSQTKKFLWDGLNNEGFAFLRYIPPHLIGARNETEMQLVLTNGSIIQLVGTDNIDRIRGTNPLGVVFSEYAVCKPSAWPIIEPVLLANDGWAVFVFTPKGKNHAYDLWSAAQAAPDRWFSSLLTINDTRDERGEPIVSAAQIAEIRADGLIDEETIQQEYYCSFSGAISGAYYAVHMTAAEKAGRVGKFPWRPDRPVQTWWDLGVDDATSIWFAQTVDDQVRLIDYVEDEGEGLPYYVKTLRDKPYVYSAHVLPHDVAQREFTTGVSRRETAIKLGLHPLVTAPKLDLADGIEACRSLIPQCVFNDETCDRGVTALKQYAKDWDDKRMVFKKTPRHDEWSHGADAFRTGAVGRRFVPTRKGNPRARID